MKSEPDVYSVDDLARETAPAMWEGCRNYTVRNFLRDAMAVGDLAFFHHSNARPSGIAGVMRIASDAYPDPTQFDPSSEYFDPKAKRENPPWLARDVVLVEKFVRVITLDELRRVPELADMLLLRKGQRLSIMPVTPPEWAAVMGLAESRAAPAAS